MAAFASNTNIDDDEFNRRHHSNPLLDPLPNTLHSRPAFLKTGQTDQPFLLRPLFGPLLFNNESSDARDHCANERTFLAWVRLAIYLAIVSIAIIVSFHLKSKPSELELRLAFPLGTIFWLLSLGCLGSGLAIYVHTVKRYGQRRALVQSGWKTQVVFGLVCTVIVGSCVLFLAVNPSQQ